jgi:cytochrome P450
VTSQTSQTVHATGWTNPPAGEQELVAWFREMRDRDPVQCDPKGGWHVFGYPEAVAVMANPADFSNTVTEVPETSPLKLFGTGNLAWMDPPRHRQLRSLVNKVFTPRYVEGMRPVVEDVAGQALRRIRRQDTVSFVDEYTFPVMLTVIARLVGIPRDDYPLFGKWLKVLLAITETQTQNLIEVFSALTQEMHRNVHALIASRRREPKDDLVSRLTESELDGQILSDDEIAGLVALLVATGEGGATQTLANAILCLDQHPAAADRLRADSGLLDGAIEEVMRFRSQTTRVARRTTRDVPLAGHVIPAGEMVSVWLTSANRDKRKFDRPDTFDMTRSPNQHISLGSGIHFCLGAPLARLEVNVVLEQFLAETESFSIDYPNSRLLDPRMICGANEIAVRVRWRASDEPHVR